MKTETKLEIRQLTAWDALHCHYERQTERQGCYIELDCKTGIMAASYNAEIGNAIPFSVYHGHDRRWGIPCLTADAANELMEEIAPLAQRVLDGYESHWDGNNHVAALTDDAQQAETEIEAEIETLRVDEHNGVSEWDAASWLAEWDRLDIITAKTTDEELNAMEEEADGTAEVENIVLLGTGRWLREKRDELRDAD